MPYSKWARTRAALVISVMRLGLAVMCWRVRQRRVSRAKLRSPRQRSDRRSASRLRVARSDSVPPGGFLTGVRMGCLRFRNPGRRAPAGRKAGPQDREDLLADGAGRDDLAVRDQVGQPAAGGVVQGLSQVRCLGGEHGDRLVQVAVGGRPGDAEPVAEQAHLGPAVEPRQRGQRLLNDQCFHHYRLAPSPTCRLAASPIPIRCPVVTARGSRCGSLP